MTGRMEWQERLLRQAVGEVARRCRRRRLLQCSFRFGLASLTLVAVFTFILATVAPQGAMRYIALAVFGAAEIAAAWLLVVRPLRCPISLQQAALLIDERHPELEQRIITAIECSESGTDAQSAWLVARLIEDSWRSAEQIPFRELLDVRRAVRWGVLGVLAWLGVFGCVGLYRSLWVPDLPLFRAIVPSAHKRVEFTVEPGDARVRRGESAVVRVLSDATPEVVTIRWRSGDGSWETAAMEQGATSRVHFHQFADLQASVEYQVQFHSTASRLYRITVWTPPEVLAIDLGYRYPEYLRMPPKHTPHGGDITAVAGTEVNVAVHVNKPLKQAELALQDNVRVALRETQPNLWEGKLQVVRNDVYRVQLLDPEGAANEYVPEYRITALPDNPPEIKIAFPRDDLDVTSIDEIPFEFTVNDDFGLSAYGLQIEVAGREPVRLPLGAAAETTRTAAGRHLLMLEQMKLAVGDLITWAVWADDGKPGRAAFETLGDPYFLQIRAFRREFEEAVSDASAQDRQQQQQQRQQGAGAAAANQKEVLIATWNLRREAKNLKQQEFDDRLTKIKEAQRQVQQQLTERGLEGAPDASLLPQALEAIEKALTALDKAEWKDPSMPLSEAIRNMQNAHRLLLRARPERSQVQMARNMSGQPNQGDRREIQELELRRNRNFYEQERQVREQREAVEAARNELRDLARRQRMINEEMNKLVSELEKDNAPRREELARQLERLREEERRALQQLDQAERNAASGRMDTRQARETSRALDQARQQMTRSLENMERNQFQQARAAGARAARALDEAGEALERLSRDAAAEQMAELQRRMQDIGRREQEAGRAIEQMRRQAEAPGSLRRSEDLDRQRAQTVAEKDALAQEFRQMLQEAAELAKRSAASQELMSRRLGDWLRQTSREEIPEKMDESRQLVDFGIWNPALELEKRIQEKLAEAEKNLAAVAEGVVRDDLEGMRRALDELRRLREAERQQRQTAQAGAARPSKGERTGTGGEATSETAQARGRMAGQPQEQGANRQGGQRQDQAGERPGERPQDNQTARADGQRAEASKQGARAGEKAQQGGDKARAGGDRRATGAQADALRGGWGDDWLAPRTAEQMREFLERGYLDWTERIRTAEALLPDDNNVRRQLERAREALLGLRGHYRGRTSTSDGIPRFDLLKETVGIPLALAAEELERQIRKSEDAEKLILTNEDAVPDKYRKRVAGYYEALSESENK
ncbi:MAG: hypothetical protein N3D11_04925 [Candidatus Sumerlaeia bacterium]|nr:hypothetical protein [Candidatus Sumerlaeia bacterium]